MFADQFGAAEVSFFQPTESRDLAGGSTWIGLEVKI